MHRNELTEMNLAPEGLFLVLCCRQVVSVDSSGAIDELMAQDLDWHMIAGMVRRHDIAGIVHVALLQCGNADRVPQELRDNLKMNGRQNALKNLLYAREFNDIVRNCNRENVRILPLNGIAFLKSMYAHTSVLRSLADMDILVEREAVPGFENILCGMGYQKMKSGIRENAGRFHTNFRRKREKLSLFVDVHWDVDYAGSPYSIDMAGCWDRSRAITSDADTFYELSLEDSIIVNCFHIFRDMHLAPDALLPLKNFCDVAKMIHQCPGGVDWECVMRRSREYKVLRPVALVLLTVRDLLAGASIPPAIDDALRSEGFRDDFGVCVVKEHIFNARTFGNKSGPFRNVGLEPAPALRGNLLPCLQKKLFTLARWVFAPRKARMLYKEKIVAYFKRREIIQWLRG
jgi:hypothetical protein